MRKVTNKNKPQDNGTVSCHVRFPRDIFEWLEARARGYRSVQEKIIDLARQARTAEEQDKAA